MEVMTARNLITSSLRVEARSRLSEAQIGAQNGAHPVAQNTELSENYFAKNSEMGARQH